MTQGFAAGVEGAPGQGNGEQISQLAACPAESEMLLAATRGCAVGSCEGGFEDQERDVGCRHSLQRALKPWGRGSEPLRRHASCEEVEARAWEHGTDTAGVTLPSPLGRL